MSKTRQIDIMKVNRTEYNPVDEIESIEILASCYDEFGNLCYPVQICDLYLTFYRDMNGNWTFKENALLPKKIVALVGSLIKRSGL
jgi:hypothetical protein